MSERHLQSEIDHCKSELREAKSAVGAFVFVGGVPGYRADARECV